MISLAHIIHPAEVDSPSDLVQAQPITFETMRAARHFSGDSIGVNLYCIHYRDEVRVSLPSEFIPVADLKRSIGNIQSFQKLRKLALIKDILDNLYRSCNAGYLIYTNVDIALQPYFYTFIADVIRQGFDAFVINRRTITDQYTEIEQIPAMYAQIGQSHKGYDCFVFRRELYPEFKLGNICIGTAWIGRAVLANMVTHAHKFREFRNEHLTFHIGDPCFWRDPAFNDYFEFNYREYQSIFSQMESLDSPFEPNIRSYLLDTGDARHVPDFDRYYISHGQLKTYS